MKIGIPYHVAGLAAVALILVVGSLQAQSTYSTIAGRIADEAGVPLPGAHVRAFETHTGLSRATIAGSRGAFAFANLPPGVYVVEAHSDGYLTARTAAVEINVNDRIEIRLTLEQAEQTNVDVHVTVDAGLEVDPALSTVVDQRFVSDLPLNGRSFQNLIAMTPGVVQTPASLQSRGLFAVNGVRPTSTYITIDGVSANYGLPLALGPTIRTADGNTPALSASGGTNSLIAVDAMREFKVLTSSYEAELGRGAGGQIAIATRSGTNDFHGSLFHFFRNDKLDANDWFSNRDGLQKSVTRQNDFGGVLGGPILKDRTFFFGAYEGFRLRQPQFANQLYPTIETRRRAAPHVRSIVNTYPLPNREDVGGGLGRFVASYSNPSELDAASGRIDHVASSSVMLFGRVSDSASELLQRGPESPIEGTVNTFGVLDVRATSATAGAIQMIGGSLSHEARFNYSRNRFVNEVDIDEFGGGRPPDFAALLPTGLSIDDSSAVVLALGLPSLAAGPIAENLQEQWAFVDTLSYFSGSHALRIGFDYRRLNPRFGPPLYSQLAIFQGLDGPVGLLNGVTAQVDIEEADAAPLQFQNWSAFIQDNWKAAPRLTLTFGLRWDYNPAPTGRNGLQVFPLANTDNPARIGLDSPNKPLFRAPKDAFAPRLGVAYRLSNRSGWEQVIRGGTGLFYDLPLGSSAAIRTSGPHERRRTLDPTPYPLADSDQIRLPFSSDPPFGQLQGFETDIRAPRVYQWSLGVNQGLGASRRLSVSYVGSAGRSLWRREPFTNPRPEVDQLEIVRSNARSIFHGFQAQFDQELDHGLQALASYSWSHSIDNASDAATFHLPFEPRGLSRGSSDFDVRHLFSGGLSWELPDAEGWLDPLTRHWGVDAVFRFQSGLPFTARSETPVNNDVELRADLVPGRKIWLRGDRFPGGRALNPEAFSQSEDGVHGSLGRNSLRGFPLRQIDLAAHRDFALAEGWRLQVRGEVFNAFNHANFATPVGDLNSRFFGRSTQTFGRGLGGGGTLGGQNPLHAAGGPRSVQLALRLKF